MNVEVKRSRGRKVCAMVAMAMVAGLSTGCISQAEYDRLFETNRSLTDENARLLRERDEARTSLSALQGGINRGEGTVAQLSTQNAELRRQLEQALADLRGLQDRIAGLAIGPVDPDTDRALKDLAARYPNLVSYDPSRGMLRFASDLTFDSGSDVVKAEAKTALQALASVLGSGAATQYEIWIEGHTDSQRISGGTAQRHPTNRHLSAHRAISVIRELSSMGVPAEKMLAAGWGEHRPAVANTSSGNTPQNRRVEIYLARNSATGGAANAPAYNNAQPDHSAPPSRPLDITK